MTTPSGQIAFSQVNAELGVSPTSTQANMGSAPFRTLAGVPTGQISMSNLRNKSNVISATGGTVIDSGGYRIHVFTSPGSFAVSDAGPGLVEYLVVAGGGGGGYQIGGGGGAGGFRTGTSFPVTATTYPITVGAGGPSSPGIPAGGNGNPSIFSTITSAGGGGGGANSPGGAGLSGGSGGGAGEQPLPAGSGNTPPTSPPQGNPGGAASDAAPAYTSGGGGGAGGSGGNGGGGIGSPITWLPASYGTPGPAPGRYFAGGGGGGNYLGGGGAGGSGGGGPAGLPGTAGTTNTGGGGGGAGATPSDTVRSGGSGGSGIVVIRYLI